MDNVVIGLLGTQIDAPRGRSRGKDRWESWRPTVALCQQDDLLVQRFELLVSRKYDSLAQQVRTDIHAVSPETEVQLHYLDFRDPWDFEEVYGQLHDFCHRYPFNPEREQYLAHMTTGTHVAQICLFLLTEAHFLPGKLVQTSPPGRRGQPAAGSYSIIDLDLARYDRIAQRYDTERQAATSYLKAGIDTRNPAFNRLIDRIEQVALRSTAPLLLTGPTGAGKTALARRIYELKAQRQQVSGAFVEVNCATLRGDGAMSALFGHRRGAFTGAATEREGLLRRADGGLLFLDEIGELGLDEQTMLLRALEERRFLPMGSDTEVESSFQLIAGTNRQLQAEVAAGRFREDLYARLNLWHFELPGLAARREDIEPNLDHELERYARAQNRRVGFNREAREAFLRFALAADTPWRANFRDLAACVTRMATLAEGGRIDRALVDEECGRLGASWKREEPEDALLVRHFSAEELAQIDRFDRAQLREVLAVCATAPTLSAAGRELFAASRVRKRSANDADRLRKYLARFELDWGSVGPD